MGTDFQGFPSRARHETRPVDLSIPGTNVAGFCWNGAGTRSRLAGTVLGAESICRAMPAAPESGPMSAYVKSTAGIVTYGMVLYFSTIAWTSPTDTRINSRRVPRENEDVHSAAADHTFSRDGADFDPRLNRERLVAPTKS
jgi:hypothetical protein